MILSESYESQHLTLFDAHVRTSVGTCPSPDMWKFGTAKLLGEILAAFSKARAH